MCVSGSDVFGCQSTVSEDVIKIFNQGQKILIIGFSGTFFKVAFMFYLIKE